MQSITRSSATITVNLIRSPWPLTSVLDIGDISVEQVTKYCSYLFQKFTDLKIWEWDKYLISCSIHIVFVIVHCHAIFMCNHAHNLILLSLLLQIIHLRKSSIIVVFHHVDWITDSFFFFISTFRPLFLTCIELWVCAKM